MKTDRAKADMELRAQPRRRTYLDWLIAETGTHVWHDSADPNEVQRGVERGIVGVTTNPVLAYLAVSRNRELWSHEISAAVRDLSGEEKAEALMRLPIADAAQKLMPTFDATEHGSGYVCAQVNPARAGDREGMLAMARRFSGWAPNIAVKLPATAAGMDVLEDCVAEGITITSTVNFTVAQAIAAGEACRRGVARAHTTGTTPGRCFVVTMVGRLDDYLRDVATDARADVGEDDVHQAGLAVVKRAHAIFRDRQYEAVLLAAAQRGEYHVTELAGGNIVISLPPSFQQLLEDYPGAREERIEREIPPATIARLSRISEFVRAYEPDGMQPDEFIAYGLSQRTLSQFAEAGWKCLESFNVATTGTATYAR